jgi:hypothetical protein
VPVLVHAAHRPLARRLTARLLEQGGQVRATCAGDVGLLRAQGVHTAACDPDDEGTLEAALTGVHTLVVLLGGLGVPDAARIEREGLAAARAAEGADISRAVLVTVAGADVDAHDPLRRAHGRVAAAFAALPLPSIELRVGLVDTPAVRDLLRTAGLAPELRARTVAPVTADALLDLVVAVDAARSRADAGHLILRADGPSRCTVESLTADASRVGRRLPSDEVRETLTAALDGPWWTEDPAVVDAWSLLGVSPSGPEVDAPDVPAGPEPPSSGTPVGEA